MPIDSTIPLQVKLPQIEDPSNIMMKILQMRGAQQESEMNGLKADEYRRGVARSNRLNDLLQSNADASTLRQNGYLKESMDLEKNSADAAHKKSETTKNDADTENKTIAVYRDASQGVSDYQSAVNFVTHMHTDPRLKDSAIARVPLEQALAQIPQDLSQIEAWKQKFSLGATKFMEMNKPQFITSNTGGKTVTTGVAGLTGQTTPIQSLQNTQSPDNAATNETSRANNAATVGATLRGQNLVDARSREANSAGRVPAGYRQKADGSLEFIPGGPADPNAAKKAAPTEFQGKAGMFGTRAQEADRIISQLEGQYSPSGINSKQALGHVPLVGGALEAGGNAMLSDASQKAEQAQRDFVNAVLRLESGAAIGKDEFDNARKQYFPQPNDRPEVKAQKAQNRKTAIQGLLNNARPGAGEQSGGATGSFAGPSVDDLLRKYGGK